MRKLLGTLMLGLIVLGLVGLVRGWFSVSTDSEENQTKIELTIDRQQLKQDTDRLKEGVQDLTQKISSSGEEDQSESAETSGEVLPPDKVPGL